MALVVLRGLFLVVDGRGVEVGPLERLSGLLAVQVLDAVAEGAELEGTVRDDGQRLRGEPFGLRVVAGFLRPDIRVEFVGGLRREDGLEGAGVAVDVILHRTAAKVPEVILLHAEAEADARDVHGLLLSAVEGGRDLQEAAGEEGVVHRHRAAARQGVGGVNRAILDRNLGLEGLGGFFPGIGPIGLVVAVVVVGGAAPEVRAQAEIGIEQVVLLVLIAPDDAEGLVEDERALAGLDPDFRLAFRHFRRAAGLVRLRSPRILHEDFVRGDDGALGEQRQRAGGFRLEEDPVLAAFAELPFRNLHGEFLGTLGRGGEGQLAFPDRLSVPLEAPADRIVAQILEIEPVLNSVSAFLRGDAGDGDVLVDVLDLIVAGMRVAVRIDDSVAQEVRVGGGVHAVIAAVGPSLLGVVQALVHPVPDESALQMRVGVNLFPLEVEGAGGVAHRVGVFGGDDRPAALLLAHPGEPVGAGVLRDEHVRVPFPFRPFVAHGTVLAVLLQGFQHAVGLVEVHAVAGLVAEGEDGHARIVRRAVVHVQDAVQVLGLPGGVVAEGAVQLVAHAVGLDVRLVIDIEAEAVAELVELPRLRVVAGADGVDVGHLHEFQVLQDVLPGLVVAGVGVVLMHVNALELDGLPVHEQGLHVAFPVLDGGDLDAAEAHVETGVFPVDLQEEGVQLGRFGRPFPHVRDGVGHRGQFAGEVVEGVGDRLAVAVEEFIEHVGPGLRAHLQQEDAFGKRGVQGGDDAEVEADRRLLAGQVYVPLDAADAPEVLALQPGGGGVAEYLEGQFVVAFLQGLGDVEPREALGVLGVADFLPVHIDIRAGLDAGEVQEDRPALPAVGHRERPVVDGGGEDLRQRGRLRVLRAEIVWDVRVDGDAVSLHLPVPRHLDRIPAVISSFPLVISSGAEKSLHLVVIVEILEVPSPVQVHVILALPESLGQGIGPAGEPDGFGAPGLGVHVRHIHVLPVRLVLGSGKDREQQGEKYRYAFHNQ